MTDHGDSMFNNSNMMFAANCRFSMLSPHDAKN